MKQRLTDEQIEGLKCPVCEDKDAGFLIYPDSDKRLIKWDCNHVLYKTGHVVKLVTRKPTKHD